MLYCLLSWKFSCAPNVAEGMILSDVLCLWHGRGPQDNDRMPWYLPVVLGIKLRGATAVIDTLKKRVSLELKA